MHSVPIASGTRIGPYEILSALGAGGMGEVYRARDTKLRRDVALKVLPDSFASDPDRLARFTREAQTLATLNHPSIAHIHGLEESSGIRALVMELVEGEDLSQRIARGPIPIDEALSIAKQIAEALEAAHEHGIIHRDLKPANVKVRPDGAVKVLDFGLAKAINPAGAAASTAQSPTITSPAMTHPGVILGTAAYMAPEQARGRLVDKRVDIWAFGAVLYEMLTGRPAFTGEDVTEILGAIVKVEPNWDALLGSASPSLVSVLRRCLEKDPKRRLRDRGDVRLLLENALEADSPASAIDREWTARWLHGQPVSSFVAGTLVASLAIGLVVYTKWPVENESSPVARFEVPFRPGQVGGQAHLALSADGQALVYRGLGADGVPRLYRRRMDEFESTPINDTENASIPFLSPGDRWLGFVVGRTLKKIALSGGASETIAELPVYPRGVTWDSESIVVGGGDGGLLRVPVAGGEPVVLASAPAGRQLWFPEVLPGGRAILFTESRLGDTAPGSDVRELQILELDSGRRRVLLPGSEGRFVSSGHIVFLRGGTVWAVAFHPTRFELLGSPVPVVNEIRGRITQFALADTGSLVYVPSDTVALRRLVWVDRAGREVSIAAPPRGYTYPRVSPDGTRVAIDVREQQIDIWIWHLERETLTRLTFDPAQDEYPVWTRDGHAIFFASFREKSWGAFLQPADGSGPAQRVGTGAKEIDPLSISPDGRTLVLATEGDVVTLPSTRTGDAVPLLNTRFAEHNAEISPDGRWIAYQSNESGRHNVYVRPFPAVSEGLWQISSGGGTHPLWAPNGRELFYISPAGLMRVPTELDRTFQFGRANVVLKGASETYWLSTAGRAYDISPDGARFLMLKEEQEAAARIHVVQNWFRELQRLMATS